MSTVPPGRVATKVTLREAVLVSGLDEARIAMLGAASRLDRPWRRGVRLTYRELILFYLHAKLAGLGVGRPI